MTGFRASQHLARQGLEPLRHPQQGLEPLAPPMAGHPWQGLEPLSTHGRVRIGGCFGLETVEVAHHKRKLTEEPKLLEADDAIAVSIEEVGEVNAVLDGDRVVPRTASAHLTQQRKELLWLEHTAA